MAKTNEFLKFDPEKISEVSIDLEKKSKLFTEYSTNIKNKIDSTKGFWQGDTSEIVTESLIGLNKQSELMAQKIMSLGKDLETASGIFKEVEAEAEQETEVLSTKGLFV